MNLGALAEQFSVVIQWSPQNGYGCTHASAPASWPDLEKPL
jgi:hypothetical protein